MTQADGADAGEEPTDLARERELLLEALTQALGAFPADGEQRSRAASSEGDRARPETDAGSIGSGAGPCGQEHGGTGGSGQQPTEDETTVGCACCGCKAPRTCAHCPLCRGAAAALDPALLERVADVATLLAEGLRAAARRLATQDHERDGR